MLFINWRNGVITRSYRIAISNLSITSMNTYLSSASIVTEVFSYLFSLSLRSCLSAYFTRSLSTSSPSIISLYYVIICHFIVA